MNTEQLYRDTMGSIVKTARLNRRVIEGKIHELGVHHSQHVLLMFLSSLKAMPSQREIAAEFDISPAAVAVTIKKLLQGGYIEKNTAQEDGRFHEIGLTPRGRAVIDRSEAMFHALDLEIFAGINEQELKQLHAVLERVQKNLKHLERKQRKDDFV